MDELRCTECAAVLVGECFDIYLNKNLCESCADMMAKCPHDTGDQAVRFDADGVGYRVWLCHRCGAQQFDPY